MILSIHSKHEKVIHLNEQIHYLESYPNISKDILYSSHKKNLEEILGGGSATNIYDFGYEGCYEHKHIYHIKYIKEIKIN